MIYKPIITYKALSLPVFPITDKELALDYDNPSILIDLMRDNRNELRKKIENYSYGLNDHLDLAHKGSTFKGLNEQTEQKVAIKVVDLRNKQPQFVKDQLNIEIEILKKLKHPNLIHCFDVYSTVNNCYIITQFCDQGDLQNRITRGPLKEPQAQVVFKDILSGFLHLAQEKYVHGNLKPSCLFIKDKVIKIGGFSNTRKISKDSKEIRREVRFNSYQSPESVRDNIFNHKSDIWSLGMILYVLLHGNFPWEYTNKAEFLQRVGKPYTINKELSEDVKEFLKRTLTRENRLPLEDLSSHPFVLKLGVSGYPPERYVNGLANIMANLVEPQPPADKAKKENHLNISRAEKQINAQVNWMRFLLRIIDRIMSYPQEFNVTVLKFIMVRQLATQFKQLKISFEKGENPFNFSNWHQFLREKERVRKYKIVLNKYQERYEKIMLNYKKYIEKIASNPSLSFLNPVLNQNFYVSEYNCILAIKVSLDEIKKLWTRITKQYPLKIKYEKDAPFKFKAELLLLDFMITYFQLNCLWVDDFIRMDYFQKNAKLEVILEVPPAEVDASNLEEFQFKLTQLGII